MKLFKRISLILAATSLGALLAAPFVSSQGSRGYVTIAPQYATGDLPTCSSSVNAGQIAWDTTTSSFKICDGSGWVESGTFGGTAISGTNNTIPVFNSAGTNIEDSLILDDGTTITLGNAVLISSSEAAANFDFSDTSANIHYPAAGALTISAGGATPSILFDGSTENFKFDTDSIANTDAFIFEGTMPLTASAQESALLNLTFISGADHTGGSLFALDIRAITGDANSTEIGVNVRSGWDQAIRLDDGSATDDTITFGASADAEIYWDNANGRFAIDATDAATGGSVRVTWSDTDGNGLQLSQAATLVHTFAGLLSTTFSNPANMVNFGQGGTIGNMDAADTWNVLRLDVVNGNHTGTTNTLNLLFIDDIAGDAESNLHAIQIGALTGTAPSSGEVESAITVGTGWDYGLSILDDGSATLSNITLGDSRTADVQMYFDGTAFIVDADATAGNRIHLRIPSSSASNVTLGNITAANNLTLNAINTANAGVVLYEFLVTGINATNGSDIVTILEIDWNETDWATSTETLNAVSIESITQDAQGTYVALSVGGSGWDYALAVLGDGSAISNAISLGASLTADAQLYFDGANLVLDLDGTAGNGLDIQVDGAASASDDLVSIIGTFGLGNGSDTQRGLYINLANADHTGAGNIIRALDIAGITNDPSATEIGLKVAGSAGGWDLSASFDGPVEFNTYRQDFDAGCYKGAQATHSVEGVSDTNTNIALCPGGILIFVFRLDGDQATPFLVHGGGLDIDNNGIDNEGVEIAVAEALTAAQGWTTVGTSPAMYMRASVTITSVSGTDNMYIGWRLNEAFVDDLVLATYDTYGAHVINDTVGNLQIQTGDDTADGTDENDQVAAFGDGETHVFEVRVATDGNFTFFINGAQVTESNATGAAAAGDIMYPFIGMLNAASADTEMTINWLEIGEVI